jgi:hypothetical protein
VSDEKDGKKLLTLPPYLNLRADPDPEKGKQVKLSFPTV